MLRLSRKPLPSRAPQPPQLADAHSAVSLITTGGVQHVCLGSACNPCGSCREFFMQIGELAKRASVSVQTLHFYERRGLIPSPPRKESGYRSYSDTDLRLLLFIRQAKRLGFSLDEINSILRMKGSGVCPCADVIGFAERHLSNIEQQINRLKLFRGELNQALHQWKTLGKQSLPAGAICSLIERSIAAQNKKLRIRVDRI